MGRIKHFRVFRFPAAHHAQAAKLEDDTVGGKTRLVTLVELGDQLNGHPGLIHGGFSAALLDELLGWNAYLEGQQHIKLTSIFTANLNVDYRRPMQHQSTYIVETYSEKV